MKKYIDKFLDWCENYFPMSLVGAVIGGIIGAVLSLLFRLI